MELMMATHHIETAVAGGPAFAGCGASVEQVGAR